jgi:hypothetical protein
VSDLHAIVERQDDRWLIVNRSEHGTYVNRQAIQTHVLENGDLVQVGAEVLLEYEAATAAPSRAAAAGLAPAGATPASDEPSSGWALPVRPSLLIGAGVYALLLVAAGIWLTRGSAERADQLTKERVDAVIESTAGYLQKVGCDRGTPAANPGDPAEEFHRISALACDAARESERAAAISDLAQRISEHFFSAWQLEQQQRWRDAERRYAQIMEMIPAIDCPSTRLAGTRRHEARKATQRD